MMTSHKDKEPLASIKPPIILALEASGAHASAAIIREGVVLAETRLDQAHGHASNFVTLAHECVQEAG